MAISLERFVTGPIETNTYLLINNEKSCLIIDPSSGCDEVLQYIREHDLTPQGIVITHGHFDHITGIPEVVAIFPQLQVFINSAERSTLTNPNHNMSLLMGMSFTYSGAAAMLDEGLFTTGEFTGEVYCVPGHSPGGCALLVDRFLLCGDILFAGSVGRTDFPGGNHSQLIDGIKSKLMKLPDDTVVCPGHGGRSTIGRERRVNPYLSGGDQC